MAVVRKDTEPGLQACLPTMTRSEEVAAKLARVREHLAREGARGVLLTTTASFAWITGGGRSFVSVASDRGVAAVLVTPDAALLIADNIERTAAGELPLNMIDPVS